MLHYFYGFSCIQFFGLFFFYIYGIKFVECGFDDFQLYVIVNGDVFVNARSSIST